MSRQGTNRSGVQGLEVYVRRQGQDNYEQIQPQTDLFPLVSNARNVLDRAFLLLESGQGRIGLEEVAGDIVAGRRDAGEACLFPDPQIPSLVDAINHFLQIMKSGFPDVYLTRTDGEAATIRHQLRPPFQSLVEFEPLRAGELLIQYQVRQFPKLHYTC
jgi:hypothetical protein